MRSVPLSVPNGKLCLHYRPQELTECAESPPVRQLHLRFTIRGMMSAVAIIGLCCALAELIYHRFGNTVYANHYSEHKFRSLGIGMTTHDVQAIMGAPNRKDSWADRGEIELWRYSESANDGAYWRRWIFFRNGRVCGIDCQYWID